jgi:ribonucleoside-diphosphate reductase alpha subunit
MRVIKRSGSTEKYSETKMKKFLSNTAAVEPSLNYINIEKVVKSITSGLPEMITSNDLLKYSSENVATFNTESYDYCMLSGRVEMSRLYSTTPNTFKEAMLCLQSILSDEFIAKVNTHDYSKYIDPKQDFTYDIVGVRTLERSYLLKDGLGRIVERPQYMLMRVAVFLNESLTDVLETYNALSQKYYTHASPTLFHSGMKSQHQLASCFLMEMKDDSIEGIFDTVKNAALISKSAGGIGLSCSNVRAKGSPIKGTNGVSNGLVPMLKVFNSTARYVDQGGGKRKGSFAIYMEPWHADIESVLRLKLNTGAEDERARDLFYALWTPDHFMHCVKEDLQWHLFCPSQVPELQETWGLTFEGYYKKAVADGKARKVMRARDLWAQILKSQIETGTPYMLYKDQCNRLSNHQHLGTIKSSNLCAEIIEYTSKDETSVCTLASICLPRFVTKNGFDYDKLEKITGLACRTLNKVIDKTSYPISEAKHSNLKHRPIGIGINGLHDVYQMMRLPFESEEANRVNVLIAETMYYGAMLASIELAERDGPYESFAGSPLSKGYFQFDLHNATPESGRYNWDALRLRVRTVGARNSLLIACMPTASTAQIVGNTESFEPRTSNLYVKRVLSGEFVVMNKHLENYCREHGVFTPSLLSVLLKSGGSVQSVCTEPILTSSLTSSLTRSLQCMHNNTLTEQVDEIFDQAHLNELMCSLFKTVWEISQKHVILQSSSRSMYVCQSQSLNLHLSAPTTASLTSMHFFAYQKQLKTGMYYLRSRAKVAPLQFTVAEGQYDEAPESCSSCSA